MSTNNIQAYYELGGTLRARSAQQTLSWLQPLLPKFGITRVADITGLDYLNITVTLCMRPNGKNLSTAQGKGLSFELAAISAIMESIETYHAENPPPVDCRSTYHDLNKRANVIDPQRFNTGFFLQKNLHDIHLNWINATQLITQDAIYIPYSLVSIDSTTECPEYAYFNVSSNGLAAGNTLEEALCHALYEIIERDALFHWQQASASTRKKTWLDNTTIDNPAIKALLAPLAQAGVEVKLWDITSSMAIPAFHCSITDKSKLSALKFFNGTGCHLSKDVALIRAITEAAQGRLTYISGSRDDVFVDYYQQVEHGEDEAQLPCGQVNYMECQAPVFKHSFSDNIKQITDRLVNQGYTDIIFVDHTKPAFNVPVVHVFVPGLHYNGARM